MVVTLVQESVGALDLVVLGGFESIHLGHRKLLSHLKGLSNSALVTFEPLPKEAMGYSDSRILLEDERMCALEKLGVSHVVKIPFNHIRDLEPGEFLELYLRDVKAIVVGENFRFGRNATGDVLLLQSWCRERGKTLVVEPLEELGGQIISTKYIKHLIHDGQMEKALDFLGYPYFLKAARVGGHKIGRKIGIPTVNLHWNKHKTRPPYGVYDGFIVTDMWRSHALASFGRAPTFDRAEVMLEIYVPCANLDVKEGESVVFGFHRFLREEIKFDSASALVEQIHRDEDQLIADAVGIDKSMDQLFATFNKDCLFSSK